MGAALSDAMKALSMYVRSRNSSCSHSQSTFLCSYYWHVSRSALDRTHEGVAKENERGLSRRIWSSSVDKDKIKDWTRSLDRSVKYFSVCTVWPSCSPPLHLLKYLRPDSIKRGDGREPVQDRTRALEYKEGVCNGSIFPARVTHPSFEELGVRLSYHLPDLLSFTGGRS